MLNTNKLEKLQDSAKSISNTFESLSLTLSPTGTPADSAEKFMDLGKELYKFGRLMKEVYGE